MSIVKEFQDFIARGNAIDMAIGIIMGTAFNAIVTSIVNDLVMPPIGMVIGGVPFQELRYILQAAAVGPDGQEIAEVAIRWGAFVNTVIQFFIIALTVFFVVRMMSTLADFRTRILPPFFMEQVAEEAATAAAEKTADKM